MLANIQLFFSSHQIVHPERGGRWAGREWRKTTENGITLLMPSITGQTWSLCVFSKAWKCMCFRSDMLRGESDHSPLFVAVLKRSLLLEQFVTNLLKFWKCWFKKNHLFIFERVWAGEGQREGDTDYEAGSELSAQSLMLGLNSQNVRSWSEVRCLTDWATQGPPWGSHY